MKLELASSNVTGLRPVSSVPTSLVTILFNNLELKQAELRTYVPMERRRTALEGELVRLQQESRSETVQCWQDKATLKKEFRTWLKQYLGSQEQSEASELTA